MIPNIRIWDKKEKRMFFFPRSLINGIIVNTRGNVVPILLNYTNRDPRRELPSAFLVDIDGSLYEPDLGRYVYMLGTGLRDENDKEIFRLDIVENRFGDRGVVKYDDVNGCFYVDDFEFKHWYDLEVVGNIFENPELLKEVKNEKYNQQT